MSDIFEDPEAMIADGEIVTEQTSTDYQRVWDVLDAAREGADERPRHRAWMPGRAA